MKREDAERCIEAAQKVIMQIDNQIEMLKAQKLEAHKNLAHYRKLLKGSIKSD